MRSIVFAIQKGGTGKTTTAAAIAQAAVYRGFKALALDLDPQAHLTITVGANPTRAGTYELLTGTPAGRLIQRTESGLDVIPASWSLTTLTTAPGSARRLASALEPVRRRYDYIIMDTPSAGELQYNALQAATDLIIPTQADIYNLQSLYQIVDAARRFQDTNPALSFTGIIITMYDGRAKLSRQMHDTIIEKAAEMGLPHLGTVHAGIAVREAAALQKSLFEYAPRARPAREYLEIFNSIANGRKRG